MGITIKDIAKIAGVSYSTVSKALNNSPLVKNVTKRKIIAIAEELGYEANMAARSLVSKKSNTIGLVWPAVDRIALSSLIQHIKEELDKHSYHMLLSVDPIKSAVRLFNRFQVDGLIIFDDPTQTAGDKEILTSRTPLLYYGEGIDHTHPRIDLKRRDGIKMAVDYLYKLGHRKIAYVGPAPTLMGSQHEKHLGYIEGLEQHQLPIIPEIIIGKHNTTWQEGYDAIHQLMKAETKVTAIIGATYELTMGIMKALQDLNMSIPEDISLVSYDNIPQMATLDIPVTAVGAPLDKVAQRLVELLIEFIRHPEYEPIVEAAESVVAERDSCRKITT